MNNVIDLNEYRKRRELWKQRGYPEVTERRPRKQTKASTMAPLDDGQGFGPRLQQIRQSLDKINKTMRSLKAMREE